MTNSPQAWSKEVVASMSTAELFAAIQLGHEALDNDDPIHPSPRLLERMDREWLQRPTSDRVAAEAAFGRVQVPDATNP